MSVLSFPEVLLFIFIIVKGTFKGLKYLLSTMLSYLRSIGARKDYDDSHEQMVRPLNDVHVQIHHENEELEMNEEIEKNYVSAILYHIHLGTTFLGHWLFFTGNGHFQKVRTVAKCDVKSIIFSSIDCTYVETFSMSFGCDIFIPSENAQHSI